MGRMNFAHNDNQQQINKNMKQQRLLNYTNEMCRNAYWKELFEQHATRAAEHLQMLCSHNTTNMIKVCVFVMLFLTF
jgi:hypothetical protein